MLAWSSGSFESSFPYKTYLVITSLCCGAIGTGQLNFMTECMKSNNLNKKQLRADNQGTDRGYSRGRVHSHVVAPSQ